MGHPRATAIAAGLFFLSTLLVGHHWRTFEFDTRVLASPISPLAAQATLPPGDTGIQRRPRFVIEATDMRVVNESDWWGSDEVFAVFQAGGLQAHTVVYGDLDAGETRQFLSGNRCAWPMEESESAGAWSCGQAGAAPPVTWTVSLYEVDFGFPWPGFCVDGFPGDVRPAQSFGELDHGCLHGDDYELMGRYRLTFDEADLVGSMPRRGDTYTNRFRVDNCSEAVTIRNEICAYASWLPSYSAYDISYRITRMEDELVVPPLDPDPE